MIDMNVHKTQTSIDFVDVGFKCWMFYTGDNARTTG